MNEESLRSEIIKYLKKSGAHLSLIDAVSDFPEEFLNKKAGLVPHSCWEILEHTRITQEDMIDFMINPDYEEMKWPDDYWPDSRQKADKRMWIESAKEYKLDLDVLMKVVSNPKNDLFSPIQWGSGQNIFREVLQIIDHTSYHLGQLIIVRRALGIWKNN